MANRYSYGYQMMKSGRKFVSREDIQENKENAMLSAKKSDINLKTPKPRLQPGQGWGRRKLFDGNREERLAKTIQEDILSTSRHSGDPRPSTNDPPPREERLVSQEDIFSGSQSQSPTEDLMQGPRETLSGPPTSVTQFAPSLTPSDTAPLLPKTPQVSPTKGSGRILAWLSNETELSDEEQNIQTGDNEMVNPVENIVIDRTQNTDTVRVEIPTTTVSPDVLSDIPQANVETRANEDVTFGNIEPAEAVINDTADSPGGSLSHPPATQNDPQIPHTSPGGSLPHLPVTQNDPKTPDTSPGGSLPPATQTDPQTPETSSGGSLPPATQNATAATKKSNYKNVKVARKAKKENTANRNQASYTRKKKSFLDKLSTIFSKSEDLHKSLGHNPDWIVAFKDTIHKESRHGQSVMANKYICLGEGPIFEKYLNDHLSYNADEDFVVISYDNFARRQIPDRATGSVPPPVPPPTVQRPDLDKEPSPSSETTSSKDKKRGHESSASSTEDLRQTSPGSFNLDNSSDEANFNPGTRSYTQANRHAKNTNNTNPRKGKSVHKQINSLEQLPAASRKSKTKNPKTKKSKKETVPSSSDSFSE